ncbi:MAG: DUF3179 domain-containing protein [Alphaproteobacteria bacterium]
MTPKGRRRDRRRFRHAIAALATGIVLLALPDAANAQTDVEKAGPRDFIAVLIGTGAERAEALQRIEAMWEPGFTPMALETIYLGRTPQISSDLVRMIEARTGEKYGLDVQAWWEWRWNRPVATHANYASFKARLYGLIDPAFANYFSDSRTATIRLDEVVWGGVHQDGIPPLRDPKMITAGEADYLDDDNIVFGLSVNGDVRAYPNRILAWHEMFVDEVGGVPVAGVYCTLCGTMILYGTEIDGVRHEMGTSGFLYRSNKLMYDLATQSLWNTIWGRPVIGPLADTDIALERMSVVTTTWGEWRRRHPDTVVLSLETGHVRDYSEGAAYRAYFATDALLFTVPVLDDRLANKAQVVGLVPASDTGKDGRPLAISADFLVANPVYHDAVDATALVILTDRSGANRVYETGGRKFVAYDGDLSATDASGTVWTLSEHELITSDGGRLKRLPAHRAFWFGWYSAYTDTRLVY